jgi:Secretory lipase
MKHNTLTKVMSATSLAIGLMSLAGGVMAQTSFPAATTKSPLSDAFYKAPSTSSLESKQPGEVIRYRTVTAKDYTAEVSKAYQLMFRTTDTQGKAVAAITTVLIPKNAPATGRKIMAYQSFYDSLTLTCTPSYLTVQGKLFEAGNSKPALKKGHVVVLTDYEGLDSQWIAGLNTAHGVLDGIRAAINFEPAGLDANAPIAMMGFSGGGHATGWAAEVAPEYAPELNIVGAAMGGVPVKVGNVARKVDGGFFSSVFLGAVVGLSRAYPEIDPAKYATPAGLTAIKDIGNRCLLGMFQGQSDMVIKYALTKSTKFLKDPNFLDLPEIAAIIEENSMGSRIPRTDIYVYEGTNDQIMPIKDVDDLVANYCAQGLKVQYNRTGGEHLGMALSSSGAMNWSLDRLDGKAAPSNCK